MMRIAFIVLAAPTAFLFVAGLALSAVSYQRGYTCHICNTSRVVRARLVGSDQVVYVMCPRCRKVES